MINYLTFIAVAAIGLTVASAPALAKSRGTQLRHQARAQAIESIAYDTTIGTISAAGLPFPPLAFAVAVAIEFGGGLLLVAGYRARYVAAALAVFSLATAISFHSNFADQNQMIHFLKNVMMAGGLLQVAAFGAGAFGIDRWRRRRAAPSVAAANKA